MKIWVDADACPVRHIVQEEALRFGIPVVLVSSVYQELQPPSGVEWIRVDASPQAVDLCIFNRVAPGELVVTQDQGLAALVLGKGAQALSPSGRWFREKGMDRLLAQRHLHARIRRGGGRIRGPRARDRSLDERFRRALVRWIQRTLARASPSSGPTDQSGPAATDR